MWTHLKAHSAKLDQVFQPLYDKAEEFDRPWSIAELKLSKDDIKWLLTWLENLTSESMEYDNKYVKLVKHGDNV